MECLQLAEVFPGKFVNFSVFRELLACQHVDLAVSLHDLHEKTEIYRQPYSKLKKLQLALNYMGALGTNLSLLSLNSSFQRTDLLYESVIDFEITDSSLMILLREEFVIVDLTSLAETKKVNLNSEYLGVVLAGRRAYLHSQRVLAEVVGSNVEVVFTAPSRTFLQYFTLGEAKLNVQYIPSLELLLVTSQSSTCFLELSGALYKHFPVIHHESSPLCVYFVSPCFIAVLRSSNSSVYLSLTGELLATLSHSTVQLPTTPQDNKIMVSSRSGVLALVLPTHEAAFDDLLRAKKFGLVLELCEAAPSELKSRAYFEYGVHKFFYERNFLEAAHFMRKSELHWAVAALFRRLVTLPSYVVHVSSPYIAEAVASLQDFSLSPPHLAVFTNNLRSLDDSVLQFRAIGQFIPYYQYLAKFASDLVQLYAQAWLFDVLLTLPSRSAELLPVLSDPNNKLPLSYCEKVLLKLEKHDLLLELFLARQVVRPPLKLLQAQHQKSGKASWLVKMQQFLARLDKSSKDFFEFSSYLFGEDSNLASQLYLDMNPPVLAKVDIEKDVVPHLMRYGGPDLTIKYLELHTQRHGDLLARLYLKETLSGRFSPMLFAKFLREHAKDYDAEALLELLPRHRLPKERLILLDILNRYEDIIHYYMKTKEISTAVQYVKYKRSPEATNHLVRKLSQLPLSKDNKQALIAFLNDAAPELFDYHYVLSTLPKSLKMHRIIAFLKTTFAYLTATKHQKQLERRMADHVRLEVFTQFSRVVAESIEVTEDTYCTLCKTKLGEGSFCYFEGKYWHLACYETGV
jgi:hypothetical protein